MITATCRVKHHHQDSIEYILFEAPSTNELLPLVQDLDNYNHSLPVEQMDEQFIGNARSTPRTGKAYISTHRNTQTSEFLDRLITQYLPGQSYNSIPREDA